MSSRFNFWLDDDLKDKLREVGKKEGIKKLSVIIVMLLTRAVAQYEQSSD